MKKKAIWMISIVTVAMLGVSVPVMAREFITSDEALSLQTTADGWEETEDKSGRMTLKKGDSIITVMHYGQRRGTAGTSCGGRRHMRETMRRLSQQKTR